MSKYPTAYFNLPPSFTPFQLRQAYRQAVKKYHPDKGGDPYMFCLITQAYHALCKEISLSTPTPPAKGTYLDVYL